MNKPDLPTELVVQQTGPESPVNDTCEKWEVCGTDLGSSFMYNDDMYIIFGDTFARDKQDWRCNVAAVSRDDDPSDGITFDRMIVDRPGHARELLSAKRVDGDEQTVIPTYGIAVGDRLFLHYMSVKHWGDPGYWDLVYSGFAWSDDAGESWTKSESAVWPADSNFGQVAMERVGEHIYIFGIPGGRFGGVQLARVAAEHLLDLDVHEYWDGSHWVADIDSAKTIAPAPVGELSVRWNRYYQRWIMMYFNHPGGKIELRVAEQITGPWSDPYIAAREQDYPVLYAPFQFPRWNDTADIYFNMSMYEHYQVFLMRTRIPDLMQRNGTASDGSR